MPGSPSITVMSLIEAGSEYETKDKNGISHFLEHMFFKGTKNRPTSHDISKELDSIGSSYNAFTGYEVTGYYAKAHYKHFDKILDVISDLYLNPTFPELEMQKEKGVIVEEINMYEDLPMEKVGEIYDQVLYGDQPAGWSIAGTKQNVKQMNREDFINYRDMHYVPGKTVLVVAGNVEAKSAFKKVEKIFKHIPAGKIIKKKKTIEKQSSPKFEIRNKETDQTHLVIGFRTFNVYDKRTPALNLISTILGGGMSSRLWHKMREELGICYYVRASTGDFTDHGHMEISAGVDKTRLSEAVKGILDEIKEITKTKVSAEELKKAKDYMIGRMYLGLESSNSLANFYGGQEIMREKIKTPKEVEKEIQKVTAADIQKVAKDIFKNSGLNMAIVGAPDSQAELEKIFSL
jgi:predicted Zn-dependent peptidase